MSYQFDHWEIYDFLNDYNLFHKKREKEMNLAKNNDKSNDKNNSQKKNVRYSNRVSVILIPTNQEYIDAGIELWYKV